jgi:hypothetical protein
LQDRPQGFSRCLLAYGRLAGWCVPPVYGIGMAVEAQGYLIFLKQSHLVGCVGRMAGQAFSRGHRRMDKLSGKIGLVMAGKAQLRDLYFQQSLIL